MHNAQIEQEPLWFHREAEKLRGEVAVLAAQYAALEQKSLRSSGLVQKLGRAFGFGAAGKLEWARFKLNFKQEQLASFVARPEKGNGIASHSGVVPQLHSASPALETARQKMERMITENPAALEPHLRRVYQPLIEAEPIR